MKNRVRNIFLIIVFLGIIQKTKAQETSQKSYIICEEKNVKIKSEFESRYIYFFFRRTNHKRCKRIDQVVDEDGNTLIKTVMKSTERGDEYFFRKFHRLVIVGKEIHEVICIVGKENGKLITYNFCGKKLSENDLKTEELLEKYRF